MVEELKSFLELHWFAQNQFLTVMETHGEHVEFATGKPVVPAQD
jgi:hypothetical protein